MWIGITLANFNWDRKTQVENDTLNNFANWIEISSLKKFRIFVLSPVDLFLLNEVYSYICDFIRANRCYEKGVFIRMIELAHKWFLEKLYFSLSLLCYGIKIVVKDISYVYRISKVVIIICWHMYTRSCRVIGIKFWIPFYIFFKLSKLFLKKYSR